MYKASELELAKLLSLVVERNASDLHLKVGEPPIIRVDSQLIRLENYDVLSEEVILDSANLMMNEQQRALFKQQQDIDLSYSFKDNVRFRVNVYTQQGTIGVALRAIPNHIRTLEELGLPPILRTFIEKRQGLVLFTGPVGHGKSTAMASLVNEINQKRSEHILTIEDPIEFVLKPASSVITQREVTVDTPNFAQALRAALREDINVLLVGEMRDLESMTSALTLAETGHLIFATLHTNDSAQTVDRIIDVFPSVQQGQIRSQLASVLLGIVSLRLLPKIGGGRVPAYEILMANHAVRNVIRDNKTFEINNIIHTNLEAGMVPMDKILATLVKQGQVELEVAETHVRDNDYFLSLMR